MTALSCGNEPRFGVRIDHQIAKTQNSVLTAETPLYEKLIERLTTLQ
jgi:hypothetical protein